jgi:hypothetical protein
MENEFGQSPVPPEELKEDKTIDFPMAIREVTIGKRIQRQEWHDSVYCFIKNEHLVIHMKEIDHIWDITMEDLLATDWISF